MITAFKFEFGVASIEKDIVSGFPEQVQWVSRTGRTIPGHDRVAEPDERRSSMSDHASSVTKLKNPQPLRCHEL
jgi:hypothetical protein